MGAGRRRSYNPRTGKWTRPKAWYDKGRKRSRKDGCYVATAVYGSYDCSQVWVLRRYRDQHLSNTWYGKFFISLYYSIGPTLVKVFGKSSIIKKTLRFFLDYKVRNLKQQGYSDMPYEDVYKE